jgi:tRNA 2-thiocytidine biosynthesis protein TtcA
MEDLNKLRKRLHNRIGRAIKDFDLIEEGDRIMVCLSGGKDSFSMLTLLKELQERSPVRFELVAFHLDQKQPGYPTGAMEAYLSQDGVPYEVVEEDTYSVVQDKLAPEATPCSLCSRLRRGMIYRHAEKHRCNKIALGHHRDDSVETLLLNMFHTGQMQGMPVRYTTDDGKFDVIRPLLYVAEDDLISFAAHMGYPIIPCNLCGSVEGRRKYVKRLLDELEQTIPHVRHSLLASMQNVRHTHLLDKGLTRLDEDETVVNVASCHSGDELF